MRRSVLFLILVAIVLLILGWYVTNRPDIGDSGSKANDRTSDLATARSTSRIAPISADSRATSHQIPREISGFVNDEAGNAIESAAITATCASGTMMSVGGIDGRFAVAIPCIGAGTFSITASAPGYTSETVVVPCSGGASPTLVLKRLVQRAGFALRVQFLGHAAKDIASVRYFFGVPGVLSKPNIGRVFERGVALLEQPNSTILIDGIQHDAIDIAVLAAGFMAIQLVDVKLAGSSSEHPVVVRVTPDVGGTVFGDIELSGDGELLKAVPVGVWPTESGTWFPRIDSSRNGSSVFLSTKIKAQRIVIADAETDSQFSIAGIEPGKYSVAALGEDGFPMSKIVTVTVDHDQVGPIKLRVIRGRTVRLAFPFEGRPMLVETHVQGGPRKLMAKGVPNDLGQITLHNLPDGEYWVEPSFTYTMKSGSPSYPKSLRMATAQLFDAVWELGYDNLTMIVSERMDPVVFDVGKGLPSYEKWSAGDGVGVIRAVEEAVLKEEDVTVATAEFGQVDKKMLKVAVAFAYLRRMLRDTKDPPSPTMAAIAGHVSAGSIRSVLRKYVSPD